MENNENFVNNQNNRETVNLGDLKSANYISVKIGETVTLTVKNLEKVKVGSDYALSSVDYRYELLTTEDKVLSISAWKLWNAIRAVMEERQMIVGLTLKITHVDREQYTVEVVE